MSSAAGEDEAHRPRVADQWIAWARTPRHDAFWSYREALRAFVNPGAGERLARWTRLPLFLWLEARPVR